MCVCVCLLPVQHSLVSATKVFSALPCSWLAEKNTEEFCISETMCVFAAIIIWVDKKSHGESLIIMLRSDLKIDGD